MKQKTFNIVMCIMVSLLYVMAISDHFAYNKEKVRVLDTTVVYIESQPSFKDKSPEEGLKEALAYYGIKCPNIVYAQAILETGHFTSSVCQNKNNLFGLYDSKNGRYYEFEHWSESVIAYKNYIQSKYKSDSSYYRFLESINYAQDPTYVNKVKQIAERK